MLSSYENQAGAQGYLDFLESEDGATFKQVLSENILESLRGKNNLAILDAGCGPGWLTGLLTNAGHRVKGCDISPQLIKKAKADFVNNDFQIADLTKKLPYPDSEFDCVVLSLSALDLTNQRAAYAEIRRVTKDKGRLIIVTVNPYYGYPVGVWKRGIIGRLLRKKPALKLRSYFGFKSKTDRSFIWNKNLTSYFYTLPEQISLLLDLGFGLKRIRDIGSEADDKKYSLRYRLHRFPIFVMLEFVKE